MQSLVPSQDRDGTARIDATTLTAPSDASPSRLHHQSITALSGTTGPISAAPAVRVSCDCARHLFMWEWALNKEEAAPLLYGNGDPPDLTNPGYQLGLCKHLIRVLRVVERQGL